MAEQPAAAIVASDRSTVTLAPTAIRGEALGLSGVYAEGLIAGLVGACTIALWFFIVDLVDGRAFYTPNVLGSALFGLGIGDDVINFDALPLSLDTVLGFTWVHLLAFLVIGCAAARLVALAEKEPAFSFGILLLFVIFEFGFIMGNMVLAEPLLHALDWTEVLTGNLLAAGAMAVIFRRRHPQLTMRP